MYFPFDKETRDQIANILGKRAVKTSGDSLGGVPFAVESFLNKIRPQEKYMQTSQNILNQFKPKVRRFDLVGSKIRKENSP